MKKLTEEHIKQVRISQLQMLCALDMFHFGKQLFTGVCSTKHTYYLLSVGDKVLGIIQMETQGS